MLLYYITDRIQFAGDEKSRRRRLLEKIAEAARSGVDFIQLREKDLSSRDLESLAEAAVRMVCDTLCSGRKPRTRLLINSRVDIAIACGADGVHLRSDDISVNDVRRIWVSSGRDQPPFVGVSCHTVEEVVRAASESADFAVFAPVFEKKDIPQTSPAGVEVLRDACRQNVPVFALGGVNIKNARSCIEAGAVGIAGIRLFQEREITGTVEFLRAIDVTTSPMKVPWRT